jgi:hypothetical protein
MNKTQLFACVAGVLVGASAFAQGTFAFSNATLAGKPKILGTDGLGIAGANYLVDVLVKDPVSGNFTNPGLIKVLASGDVVAAPVSPLTGANAGLFAGGTIKIPTIAPDASATIKVIAWDKTTGATYDAATTKGSITFDIAKLGGSGSPPSLPAAMANFASFSLTAAPVIPEPSTYALAALGLGGLLLFRRK